MGWEPSAATCRKRCTYFVLCIGGKPGIAYGKTRIPEVYVLEKRHVSRINTGYLYKWVGAVVGTAGSRAPGKPKLITTQRCTCKASVGALQPVFAIRGFRT